MSPMSNTTRNTGQVRLGWVRLGWVRLGLVRWCDQKMSEFIYSWYLSYFYSSASSHVTNTTRNTGQEVVVSTGSSESVSSSPAPNPSPAAANLPLHLKLQDQHQYPFAAVAAALHNQIPAAHNSRYGSPLLYFKKIFQWNILFNKNFFNFQNFQNIIDLEFKWMVFWKYKKNFLKK